MNRQTYYAYLQTPYWAEVKQLVWKRAKCSCERCGCNLYGLRGEVHHRAYRDAEGRSIVGCEKEFLDRLELLCPNCHDDAHPEVLHRRNHSFSDFLAYANKIFKKYEG